MKAKKSVSMKVLVLMMALVLLIGCGIGGTVAYLMAKTSDVTNTFVVGNIGTLELTETDDDGGTNHEYIITPGVDIKKMPKVKYAPIKEDTSFKRVPVYVFVKVNAAGWTVDDATHKTYTVGTTPLLSWSIASGWTYLTEDDGANIYYRALEKDATLDVPVMAELNDNSGYTIDVSSDITTADLAAVSTAAGDITFTAYAIQQEGFDGANDTAKATAAWAQASDATNP